MCVNIMHLKGNKDLLTSPHQKIAVVGSRNCSSKDREEAQKAARKLAKSGYIVVSGLANGIDTHAHLGALQGDFPQIAVVPLIDKILPENNQILAEEILDANGLIIAPDDYAPIQQLYLIRDKLIVNIADYVLGYGDVLRGGTAYTYEYAKTQKKLLNHGFIEALK